MVFGSAFRGWPPGSGDSAGSAEDGQRSALLAEEILRPSSMMAAAAAADVLLMTLTLHHACTVAECLTFWYLSHAGGLLSTVVLQLEALMLVSSDLASLDVTL